jgi:hypothetical protein
MKQTVEAPVLRMEANTVTMFSIGEVSEERNIGAAIKPDTTRVEAG